VTHYGKWGLALWGARLWKKTRALIHKSGRRSNRRWPIDLCALGRTSFHRVSTNLAAGPIQGLKPDAQRRGCRGQSYV